MSKLILLCLLELKLFVGENASAPAACREQSSLEREKVRKRRHLGSSDVENMPSVDVPNGQNELIGVVRDFKNAVVEIISVVKCLNKIVNLMAEKYAKDLEKFKRAVNKTDSCLTFCF